MIKFPTANGIATITTKRETLYECRRMEEARGPAREGRITFPQTQSCDAERITNRGRKESPVQTDKVEEPDGTIQPSPTPSKKDTQTDEKGMGKGEPHQKSLEDKPPEKVVIHDDYPDQTVIIGGNLSAECRSRLVEILQAYVDDMVIKSKTEPEMIKDVEETLLTLKKVNMKLNPKKCSFKIVEGKFLGYIVTFEGIRANSEKAKVVINMPSPSNLKQMQRLSGKLAALNRFIYKAAERALPCLDTLRKCTNKKDFYWTTEVEEAFQAMKKLITELATLTAPKKEEELMVYLSAANEVTSVVLLVEREGRQALIDYVSRTLQGAEVNYPPMEKLALALIHAARRLRMYFQGHAIKVITDKPINQILNNRETKGRLAKWGIELEAYGIKYAPKKRDKGTKGESMEEQEVMETKAPKNLRTEEDIWKLYTDGASNKHGSGAGLILIDTEAVEYPHALRLNLGPPEIFQTMTRN
ncbi:reverse transcriptase domain-containing protein [Tanacetum coccineum]|uniref:Reverse transcriptase domain-containing protein n=1 Tax=Tanacetum coccineum TaxID=301880 RepID=A0ABQ5DKU6_9ASTR